MNSKLLRILLVMVIATGLILSGCGQKTADTAKPGEKPVVKVAATNLISGKMAAIGKIVDDCNKMALEDYNNSPNAKAKIVIDPLIDMGDSPVSARSGMEKLIDAKPNSAVFIIMSSTFSGLKDLVPQIKGPLVCTAVLGAIYDSGYKNLYGAQTIDREQVQIALSYWVQKLGKKKIVAMLPNDDTGKSVHAALDATAKKLNVEVFPEYFNVGDNDLSANITRAKKHNPDFYFANVSTSADLGRLIKQMRQMGIPANMMSGTNLTQGQEVLALLTPQDLEGLYAYNTNQIDLTKPAVAAWAKRFKDKYGYDVDGTSQQNYDCALMLFTAAGETGGDPDKMNELLHKGGFYTGLTGLDWKADEKGLFRHEVTIQQFVADKKIKNIESFIYKP